MTRKKPNPSATDALPVTACDQEDEQAALEYLAEAWNHAEADGIPRDALAHASLFAALAMFVRLHGDEQTAALIAALPERIRCGEYNLSRSLQ